jgi:hypothetical protein
MNPTTFGPIEGGNIFAGTQVSGGSFNVTINGTATNAHPACHIVIPFPCNKDAVFRSGIFDELERLLPPLGEHQSAALWGLGQAPVP